MFKKRKITLFIVGVILAISAVISLVWLQTQPVEKPLTQEEAIPLMINAALDDFLERAPNKDQKSGSLMLPTTTDNIDAVLYEDNSPYKQAKTPNQETYIIKLIVPSLDYVNAPIEAGKLLTLDNLPYKQLSVYSYVGIDLLTKETYVSFINSELDGYSIHEGHDASQSLGKKIFEQNNYKVEQNPKASLDAINSRNKGSID